MATAVNDPHQTLDQRAEIIGLGREFLAGQCGFFTVGGAGLGDLIDLDQDLVATAIIFNFVI